MPNTMIQPSFTAGELAPAMYARVDLEHYAVGLKTCRNWIVHPHGGVSNRPGTQYVTEAKDSSKALRLIPFEFNTEQTYVLLFGDYCMRVIKDGGQVVLPSAPSAWVTATAYVQGDHVASGGVNYYCFGGHTSGASTEPGTGADWATVWHALTDDIVEIPTPYAAADLADLGFTQSADVLTLAHRSYPIRNLSRLDHHIWVLESLALGSTLAAPTIGSASPSGTHSYYVVSAFSYDTGEESLPSAAVGGADPSAADVTVSWSAVSGADEYYVYKSDNAGVYGYIGTSTGTSFKDTNISPVYDDTPANSRTLFDGAGGYPSVATYHQQRLCFANSTDKPQTVWMSQTGLYNNFNTSSPSKDSDSISFTLAARQVNEIRHLISLKELVVLTSGGEWICKGDEGSVITPASVALEPQSYRGAAKLRPIISGNIVLYVQARGYYVRSLTYKLEDDGYSGDDLSVRAPHLFLGHQLVDWDYAQIPHSIVWAVRDDGTLLGLTYMLEQNVWGWHRHDTDGSFEAVCCVSEGSEDATYLVVKRTIQGVEKRYVERLASRVVDDISQAWFVDSGLEYQGVATGTVTGLDHLNGKRVSALADGNAYTGILVDSGSITLPGGATAEHWVVGLPIEADLETLSPEVAVGKFLSQGRRKRIAGLTLRLERTRGIKVGPDADMLTELKPKSPAVYGSPYQWVTGDERLLLRGKWDREGNLFIRQSYPLPATVLAVIPEIEIGGT